MAPSIVQVAGNSGTSTVSIGSGQGWSTPTSGNWIVIHAVGDTVLSTPSGYSLAVSGVNYSGNYIWYRQSNGTESTLSFSVGSGSARVFQAYELAGMQSSSVLDRTTSNGFGDAAISGSSGTTATTTVADEVAVAGAGGYQTFGPITVSSWSNSYTERDDRWQAPNMGATAARILTSTQTTNTTASFSNNISGGFVMIATFKGATGAALTVAALDHTVTLDGVALTQAHTLTPASLDVAVALDQVALTQTFTLAPAPLDVAVALDGVQLTQAHTLTPASLDVAVALDAVTLVPADQLEVAGLDHTVTLDGVALTQAHTLTPASLDVAVALDAVTLVPADQLEVAGLDHTVTLDGVALTQAHTLTPASLDVAVALGGPLTLTEHTADSIVVQTLDHTVTLDEVALTQVHTLTPAALDHAVQLDGVTITVQAVQLTVAGLDLAVALDGVALSVTHVLAVQSMLLAVVLASAEAVAWSVWTGDAEVDATLEGVWDGTTVQPYVSVEVTS